MVRCNGKLPEGGAKGSSETDENGASLRRQSCIEET